MNAEGGGGSSAPVDSKPREVVASGPSRWSGWTPALRWGLPVLLVVYGLVATLYAVQTPAWQAPDEPAHYNYIRTLAEQHRFPILKLGDYPASYLEEIKAAKFPPEMSIDPLRYEFHQPPLYYILAVPVYRMFGGQLLPLRLLSVLMGGLLLVIAYWLVRIVAAGPSPSGPSELASSALALGTTGFVAFVPMHLTFMASVNNDILAELLLATVLLLSVRYLRMPAPLHGNTSPNSRHIAEPESEWRLLVLLGVTTGLGFVTKTSVYIAAPLVLMAILARRLWLDDTRSGPDGTGKALALYLVPALGLALPWWVRNLVIYGPGHLNFLGLGRHAQVVVGQLRTAEFVAEHGMARLAGDFFVTTFRSFWGQFGWMGVLLDQRLYQVLAILSATALVGFVAWCSGAWQRRCRFPTWQWTAGGLLAVSGLLTLASYIWYNTGFLQHQGRYLFPALVPLGLAAALGFREALRRRRALVHIVLAAALVLAGGVLRLAGVLSNWPALMLIALAAALGVRRLLPEHWDPIVHSLPYLVLIGLDLVCLYVFIVPQLAL